MNYRFGSFEADEEAFELRRAGQRVAVQRRVLETIFVLLRSGGRLVTKEELVAGPWKGVAVTDGALSQTIMLARRTLGSGAMSKAIVTVRGLGVRFTGDVAVGVSGGEGHRSVTAPSWQEWAASAHGRLARLPLRTQALLACASVLDTDFSLDQLCAATSLPDDEARAALLPALRQGFIRPSRSDPNRFELAGTFTRRLIAQALSARFRRALAERMKPPVPSTTVRQRAVITPSELNSRS